MSEFRITSYPGYNREGHGQHATEIVCAVIGTEGAMTWRLATGISPEGPYPSAFRDGPLLEGVNLGHPMSMGVFDHAELTEKTAHEENIHENCEHLEGRACASTYTHFSDKECMKAFASEGFDGVRKVLERVYREHYGVEP